ncbi:MAG: hypothetical protein PUC30_06335 [Lachnospiraceae bacterium]|nr:hypothetical protein [Lachnospiraceae bacterium]
MGIERYRAIVRLEEIRSLLENGEYEAAKEAADSIRKERLKDSADLFLLATVYRKCGDFVTAKDFLRRIYEKKVTWRVLEEMMEVCLAEKNPDEAEQYLRQYAKLSGGDPRSYIYEYRIGRQKHRPDEELLPILQTLKAEEYTEKYAYELAKLYHKLGMERECMAECADLILWFGEGTYVERAKALQAYYRGELSAEDIRQGAQQYMRAADEMPADVGEALDEVAADAGEALDDVPADVGEALDEVAAADLSEPMWEPDTCADLQEETEFPKETPDESDRTELDNTGVYEQMSLFAPEECEEAAAADEYEEMPVPDTDVWETKEKQVLSELGPELSARLSAEGLVFEEALHEFAQIERVRKQLSRMLEVVVTVRRKCHCLIITGEKQSGKTTLGTYLAKLLYELSYVKSPRVAKISANRFNQINLYEKSGQLKDCCLIVEKAGELTEEAMAALLEFIQNTDVLGTVILEDEANAMSSLLRNHAECNRLFNNRVHLPKYDSNELTGFALEYIKEQDYEISGEAMEILKQKIEHLTRVGQKEGRLAVTMEAVKEAIENADYRNQGTILAMAAAGKFLNTGGMELMPEDFGVTR